MLQVGNKGVASLPCDYVLTNILDMSAIESMAVLCTSCKAKEKAVARCSDCANYLCPNCNTAHQVSWLFCLHFTMRNCLYRCCDVVMLCSALSVIWDALYIHLRWFTLSSVMQWNPYFKNQGNVFFVVALNKGCRCFGLCKNCIFWFQLFC
jgi:hypothetical protein